MEHSSAGAIMMVMVLLRLLQELGHRLTISRGTPCARFGTTNTGTTIIKLGHWLMR